MADSFRIGDMDTVVVVQGCEVTRGAEGEKVMVYSEHSRPFAKIERTISEAVSHDNLEEGNTLTLTMYKIHDMTTRWRVLIDDVPYEITAIDPIARMSAFCELTVTSIDR